MSVAGTCKRWNKRWKMYLQPNSHIDQRSLMTECGKRTSALANEVAMEGFGHAEFARLSNPMCWDSMLLCAGLAQGVYCEELQSACDSGRNNLTIMNKTDYGRVFDWKTREVRSMADLLGTVQPGSFIGFIGADNQMAHAMIYIGDGFGAGNKNDCVFGNGWNVGWQKIDLRRFFTVDAQRNAGRRMVARRVEGQAIT
jgi:hypothetical protein